MSKKISQLVEITTVLDTDVLPVVNSGETKKVTKANLLKGHSFVDGETPAGLINGINTVFTTANNFTSESLHIYLNGLRLPPTEYSETDTDEITFSEPPEDGDSLLIDYRK